MAPEAATPRFEPLPPGFRLEHEPPSRWWILRNGSTVRADSEIWDAWSRGDGIARLAVRGGRAPAWLIPLGEGGGVLRHYRRGGMLGSVRGDRFWGPDRFLAELRASEAIRAVGVPSPEILGLYLRRTAGPYFRGWVISKHVPGGSNLRDWVHQRLPDLRERARILRLSAESIASLHAAGCLHGDLNLANLLLAGDVIHVLDLDGARLRPSLGARERCGDLLRLYRSLAKETADLEPLSGNERLIFLKAYCRGNPRLLREVGLSLSRRWGAARLRRRLSRALRWRSAPEDPGGPGRLKQPPGR